MSTVQNREVILEPPGDIVGVEDRILARAAQAARAHRRDVHPGDGEDTGAAPGSGRDAADGVFTTQVDNRMSGQEIHQVRGGANRSHAWTAPAVWDAKRFVQVKMADVRSYISGPAQPDLGIEVGAVHVHLTAVGVNDFANFPNGFLK